jgi:transposase
LELSSKKWVFAVQLPGSKKHTRQVVEPSGSALVEMIERLKARSLAAGRPILRMILTYEAGRDGFWLARFLQRRGVEVHVMQASSLPVDRRARRAKTDMIDVEMLLRTLLAWLRGEPRVCSMVPIPSEADEEARRAHREREDLTGSRRSLANKIDGILATLGISGFRALRRDRREQLANLRQPDGAPVPPAAQERVERLLDRLELVLKQIKTVEAARDAVVKKSSAQDERERMIRDLVQLCGIGAESATLLVREAFCRDFANRRSLGAYAGLTGTPFCKRRHAARAGHQQGRQPAAAGARRGACLVLVAVPAGQRACEMVSRASDRSERACGENHDRGAGAKAADRAVAFRQGWRHSGGSNDEGGITNGFRPRSISSRSSAEAVDSPGLQQERRFTEWRRR